MIGADFFFGVRHLLSHAGPKCLTPKKVSDTHHFFGSTEGVKASQ